MHLFLSFLFLFFSWNAFAVAPGDTVSNIVLEYGEGKKVTGEAFDSDEMKGKVAVLFYVDPDEKDLNEDFSAALADKKYDSTKYKSYAVINMAATWLPNFAIASSLKEKQEKYPNAVYVMDMRKNFVKKWGLGDDTSVVVIMDKDGKVLYRHDGKLDENEMKKAFALIEANL